MACKPSLSNNNQASIQPNLVVVQSESFFDPRRAYATINRDVLTGFDRICRESCAYGPLEVSAWGANTVRTEFSFLTGIDSTTLGVDRFNPYRRLVNDSIPTIARVLKQRGYRTVCVHPYPASFYRRDVIFPLLGFDDFVDINQFQSPREQGTYISDADVTDKVIDLLADQLTRPLFIFVITMENHGPLHLEKLTVNQAAQWLLKPPDSGCEDLSAYLRHIANADTMMTRLTYALSQGSRPGVMTWYGDHVPIMENVYARLGTPEGDTDYFVWRSDKITVPALVGDPKVVDAVARKLSVHRLAATTLNCLFTL